MSIFFGTNAGETITPELVSASVTVFGAPKQPSAAVDLIFAGGGNDTVAGGGGDDLAFLGAGDDTFIWRPGDGNDFVSGGAGADRLVFDGSAGSENITISGGAFGLARVVRGAGNATVNLTEVERIEIAALDGQDRIMVSDLAHTGVRDVAIDLAGAANPNGGDEQADTVIVNGGKAGEQITLALQGSTVVVNGLFAKTTIDHADAGVDQLEISAGGGDDRIDASLIPGGAVWLTLDGGAGNDSLIGGGGADVLLGGEGNDTVTGGRGIDVALLGAGDDTFVWNPGDGSDTVEGQAGIDTLLFNGANIGENIDIAANGARALFTRNVANVTMDLNGVEQIHFTALGGQDNVNVHDLSGTGVTQVAIDLAGSGGSGDGQADRVTLEGTAGDDALLVSQSGSAVSVDGLPTQLRIDHADANQDSLVIEGGGGDDLIDAAGMPAASVALVLDGGAGNDVLRGGAGDDVLSGGEGNDELSGGSGADQLFGEGGDDRLVWNPGDGSDLVEGGAGSDTLEVNGGNGAETFTITANGTRERVDRVDPAPFGIDVGTVEHIVLNANGGDDVVSAGNGLSALVQLTIDGGAGNDTITGGDGADELLGGEGDDTITGGRGSDVALLGAGDDVFVWNPGDGSDTVEGGTGMDTMLFNGANIGESIDISANGERVRFTRNVANITMDLNDVEQIHFAALGGADNITVHDLSHTDVGAVEIDLGSSAATGDGQVDTVSAQGSDAAESIDVLGSGSSVAVVGLSALVSIEHADGGMDRLVIQGMGGDDTISAATLPAGSMALTLDGGVGNDTLIGGADADMLLGGEGNDTVTGGRGNDTALLGAGDDVFIWNPGDGSDTVEGQAGSDQMLFNGSNANENIDIAANGGRVHFFRDVGNVTMDLNGVEQIHVAALGGQDNIVVNDLSGTDARLVEIDLAGAANAADGQPDRVTVLGSAGTDAITVAQQGEAVIVTGLTAQVTIEHAEAQSDLLIVNAGAGDDTIDASGLGAGYIGVQLQGADGADVLIGSAGDDLVSGGRGNDVGLLGAGDDTFVWNPGDGSDTVEGQAGSDTLVFNGSNVSENIDLSANGARALFTRDVASVTMDLNGVERIHFTALGGQDNIRVHDLSGTDVTQVAIDLAGPGGGDGQPDRVTLEGTAGDDALEVSLSGSAVSVDGLATQLSIDHADANQDSLVIEGGGGDDLIDASGMPAASVGLVLDGGSGNDVLRGGAGDDVLSGGEGDDILDGGDGHDVLAGGAGSDIFQHGQVTIEDFQAGAGGDKIDLHGVAGATDFASVLAHAQDVSGNVLLDFGQGEQMTLDHVNVASLHADNFLL